MEEKTASLVYEAHSIQGVYKQAKLEGIRCLPSLQQLNSKEIHDYEINSEAKLKYRETIRDLTRFFFRKINLTHDGFVCHLQLYSVIS